jgi:zinc and cadmium transporter
MSDQVLSTYILFGIVLFFLLEKILHWRHCHKGQCDAHSFTYLNLVGDGVHNFIDGMIVPAAFVADIRLGIATTLAIAAHEIPQEIGDFAVLIYGGFSRSKALAFNLSSAVTAMAGAIITYFSFERIIWLKDSLIPFTAGGFIYIALVDLIPELHRRKRGGKFFAQGAMIGTGLLLMWWLKIFFEH